MRSNWTSFTVRLCETGHASRSLKKGLPGLSRTGICMEKRKISRSALSYMNAVVGKKKWYVFFLMIIQAYLGGASVITAMLLREIIDDAVEGSGRKMLGTVTILLVFVLATLLIQALARYLEELSRASLENAFKKRLFSTILHKDYASVTAVHSGEWLNRLTSDAVVVADGITQIVPGMVGMIIRLFAALVMLVVLEPRFGYILLPGGLLVVAFTYGFRKKLKQLHKLVQEADGRLRIFLSERIGSLLIVHTFSKEEQVLARSEEYMKRHKAARMRKNHFSNLCNFGFGALMNGAYVAGAVYCCYGLLYQTISYGTMTAILQLVSQVQSPMANITGYLPRYYAVLASCERLMEAESFQDDCQEGALSKTQISDFYTNNFMAIQLQNASFTYQPAGGEDGQMPVVLKNLNLQIKKGDYVAVAGPSGCGKSTLLKLMMCLYPLDFGERYLFCTDGSAKKLTSGYRGLFAYVPQGNQLLSGSLREIIAFGDQARMNEEEAMCEALRISCAEDFVRDLEQGLDTVLGERGLGLSEGQMQRIAIARAIFSGSPVLMLDEATSSLDEATEQQLLKNLRSMTDRTVLIVTHRMAVLAICDQCIYMEPGGVRVEKCGKLQI